MRYIAALLMACLLASTGEAQPVATELANLPVAVRWWGQGMVSIETCWNLTVVIDPYGKKATLEGLGLPADLVLRPSECAGDEPWNESFGTRTVNGYAADGSVIELNHWLDRLPNTAESVWYANSDSNAAKRSTHAIHIQSYATSAGYAGEQAAIYAIDLDGVRIVFAPNPLPRRYSIRLALALTQREVDLLVIQYPDGFEQSLELVEMLHPRQLLPVADSGSDSKNRWEDEELIAPFIPALSDDFKIERSNINTLALAKAKKSSLINPQIIVLNDKPWQPSDELATLLKNMDTACKESQAVFAKLSAEQMSWQPPNGTHTPRWNAEHMMGRQLGFFSQIYAAIEPDVFSHIDLNPKQMPDDYQPAHPDWDGAEEARQMERANAYARRFAYLLEGLDLDAKAPGSFWTPRRLLRQMERHYGEHTANVVKKMELDDWPGE